jgi:ABC-type nitrate/sulfonate/bicarbonate transport system substrate-binding protein
VRHRRTSVYRIAACLVLALALWAGAAAARAAGPLIPLEVGTMPGDASAEVYYGVERGFFKAEGLDVQLRAVAAKMTRSTYGTSLDPALMQPVLDMFLHFGVLSKPMSAADLAWQASPAYPRVK